MEMDFPEGAGVETDPRLRTCRGETTAPSKRQEQTSKGAHVFFRWHDKPTSVPFRMPRNNSLLLRYRRDWRRFRHAGSTDTGNSDRFIRYRTQIWQTEMFPPGLWSFVFLSLTLTHFSSRFSRESGSRSHSTNPFGCTVLF